MHPWTREFVIAAISILVMIYIGCIFLYESRKPLYSNPLTDYIWDIYIRHKRGSKQLAFVMFAFALASIVWMVILLSAPNS
jgi:hypothetical protein